MSILRSNLLLMSLTLAGFSATGAAQELPAPAEVDYGVIAAKSIFLKNRQPEPIIETPKTPPPPSPEQMLVLRGIVFQDGIFQAHFEGMDRKMTAIQVGEPIALGEITEIRMDGISYRNTGTGRSVWVGPGRNLTGAVSNFRE